MLPVEVAGKGSHISNQAEVIEPGFRRKVETLGENRGFCGREGLGEEANNRMGGGTGIGITFGVGKVADAYGGVILSLFYNIHNLFYVSHLSHKHILHLKSKQNLTTVGTKGGLTRRSKSSSQCIVRKNACFLTSSASRSLEPRRRSGFFRRSYE